MTRRVYLINLLKRSNVLGLQCRCRRIIISKFIRSLILCNIFLFLLLLWSESNYGKKSDNTANLRHLANQMNLVRRSKALSYITNLNASQSRSFYVKNLSRQNLELVVSIPTVRRPNQAKLGYLLQTAAMFDQILKADQYFGGKIMILCNTDENPDEHSEMTILQNYFLSLQLYGNLISRYVPTVKNISNYRRYNENKFSKEAFDYMFCLKTARLYNPKYILMVEDDALPREDLLPVLHQLLQKRQSLNEELKRKSFLLMKLYYPERWLGYANEISRIIELLGIGSLGWGFSALLSFFVCKKSYRETITIATLASVCLLLFALLIGRQRVMELRRLCSHLYFIEPSPGCCTPAIIYQANKVNNLIDYLLKVTYDSHRPIDIAIHEYSSSKGQSSLYVEPNLFRHTGMFSSLGKAAKDPKYYIF